MTASGGRWDGRGLIGREGQLDSNGRRINRTQARLELWDEKTARALTKRCSWFCGDYRCPEQCTERDGQARS